MSDVTRILTAIEQGDAKATDELLPIVARSGGHLACRRAVASSPVDRGAVAIQAFRKFQRFRQVGRFFRVAGRTPSTSGGTPAATFQS